MHDLSFAERREAKTRNFLLLAFGFLAVAASVVTAIAARLSWRGWSKELRGFLRSGTPHPEFRPILRDVRELVDRIVAEKEADREGGDWTPQRLKQTLNRYLHVEKVVIVANREPYIHERTEDGGVVVRSSGQRTGDGARAGPAGLLRSLDRPRGRLGGPRDRRPETGAIRVPPGEESYLLRRVWLSSEEEKGYYYGFCQ